MVSGDVVKKNVKKIERKKRVDKVDKIDKTVSNKRISAQKLRVIISKNKDKLKDVFSSKNPDQKFKRAIDNIIKDYKK